jgi:predicted RNase H-like HicB family nuclease
MTQNVHVRIRFEDRAYWATVDEYPGVFATGDTLEELHESLEEGLSLVIEGADPEASPVQLSPLPAGSGEPLESVAISELTLD